ncbi:hypothetical protein [Nitrosomonas sp.]|uniref:hypothetical protein n=1 Tax=Nitrosomonas sp. TaxID=42353 RepID=UPI0037CAEED2
MGDKQITPGPWLVKELLPPAGEPEQFRHVILWDDEKRSLKRRVDDHKGRFTEADARLIAAAPDLVYALQLMLGNLEDAYYMSARQRDEIARNAIKKATGL